MGLPLPLAMRIGAKVPVRRLPFRDPRTVARDIPGVFDILFPRLTGGLVASLNRGMFGFKGLTPVPEELVEQSRIQRAMLFELAMVRAENILDGETDPNWDSCLTVATARQRRHYDSQFPVRLEHCDLDVVSRAAANLVAMLRSAQALHPDLQLARSPVIPGLGWVASGFGDFSLGSILIEVKHTDRNSLSADFRQILMYWLLRYAAFLEGREGVWSDCLLLNPRRNAALLVSFDGLMRAASANLGRVELFEILRSAVGENWEQQ